MSGKRPSSAALLGVPGDWETAYQPALARLRDRMAIAAVFAAKATVCGAAAERLASCGCRGIRASLSRPSLDGALLIDDDWWSSFALAQACEMLPAVYWRVPAVISQDGVRQLHANAVERGQLIVPEFRLRYTPATLRLRELLVTDLGPAQSVEIRLLGDAEIAPRELNRHLVDWCRAVLCASCVSLGTEMADMAGTCRMVTTLRLRRPHDEPLTVRWQINARAPQAAPADAAARPGVVAAPDRWPLEFAVACKYGEARLEDAQHLRWRLGGQEHVESLANDRSAVDVALDHFARRLAGGLVPIPDLGDLLIAEHCCQIAHDSVHAGRELPVGL